MTGNFKNKDYIQPARYKYTSLKSRKIFRLDFFTAVEILFIHLTIVLFLTAGCASKKTTYEYEVKPAVLTAQSGKFMAGIAKINITPPPGMPMAGYSLFSGYGKGVRTKLMARVIYLRPAEGKPVAVVQCDLLSGSLIVHHKVAELIKDKTDIDAGGLVISGTHTHSGPGNYLCSMFYNNTASNASGFDDKYFDFLCAQIAGAIIKARDEMKPAKIATATTEITGVSVNRSIEAYHKNKEIIKLENKPGFREAINPYMHMIRIDCLAADGMYKPAAAFSIFSMHANSSPEELGLLYNGDVFAYMERELEWKIKNSYRTEWEPVHAAANYTHGDSSPDYNQDRPETFRDIKKIGVKIAEKAFILFISMDNRMKADAAVRYSAREIDLFRENAIDGIKIAESPAVGMATLSGAQMRGRNGWYSCLPFFAPGWPRWFFTGGEHGQKRLAGGPLQSIFLSSVDFPHLVLLQIIEVGNLVLLPLPFEVTYEMGTRIASAVKGGALSAGADKNGTYAVVSVSNGYCGYLTTAEEYSLQYYEGASNLYGPNTGDFLSAELGHLAAGMPEKGNGPGLINTSDFKMDIKSFYPDDIVPAGPRSSYKDPEYHKNKNQYDEPYWSFTYYDVPPCLINLHDDLVKIETSADGKNWEPLIINNIKADDNGYDIAVIFLDKISDSNMGLYEIRWYNPESEKIKLYRFAIMPRAGREIFYSSVFSGSGTR